MKTVFQKMFAIMVFAILMIAGTQAFELKAEQTVDDFLAETGMPQEVIDQLSENHKALIYESIDLDAEFSFFDSQDFVMGEDGEITRGIILPDNILHLDLLGYKGTLDSREVYVIFPSFSWRGSRVIKNDTFSFLLTEDWEVVIDSYEPNYNLCVHKIVDGRNVKDWNISPHDLLFNGQSYRIPIAEDGLFEGNAIFYAEKKTPSASCKAIVHYVHDTTLDNSCSYSLGFKYLSISITQNGNYLDVANKYVDFTP